jgi:hypothetical protein
MMKYTLDTSDKVKIIQGGRTVAIGNTFRVSASDCIEILNAETAPLHEELATLRAALQTQSEELARLRKGIRDLIEKEKRGIAKNEPFNEAFYMGRVDSMRHTLEALEKLMPQDSTEKDEE